MLNTEPDIESITQFDNHFKKTLITKLLLVTNLASKPAPGSHYLINASEPAIIKPITTDTKPPIPLL